MLDIFAQTCGTVLNLLKFVAMYLVLYISRFYLRPS